MAINFALSAINDVCIGFLWTLAFFLEPLSYSPVLFLWASDGSDASRIYVSIPVSFSSPSSINIYCFVTPLVAFSMCGSPFVELRRDFFFILVFFYMALLPPS
jgi:hypothetical protein